jgi:hypothetical protein
MTCARYVLSWPKGGLDLTVGASPSQAFEPQMQGSASPPAWRTVDAGCAPPWCDDDSHRDRRRPNALRQLSISDVTSAMSFTGPEPGGTDRRFTQTHLDLPAIQHLLHAILGTVAHDNAMADSVRSLVELPHIPCSNGSEGIDPPTAMR